ncbi:DUF4843 domain-containing protein [Proteiniphilum sp. UBA5384]|uniref:DUF4843 domain-containing protein n=1 Tax=Proteiniphilum sp. UBA5384 TaxID=1947279 RepID=UPI0025E7D80D|nr:DUF4843 domain-containing protein [Proteiniphilum sp. UBA5384]
MKNIVSFTLFLLILSGISCKENVALEYENDPAIYFVHDEYGQRDSISHSFFIVPGDGPDTVYIEIHTMGMTSNVDRPFVLEQSNIGKPDAAVAGVHYVPFDNAQVAKYFVIPANQVMIRLPIILLRDESLKTGKVRLELKFASNEYFRPGIPGWTHFLVTTTAEAVKPTIWDSYWKSYFGLSWGSVKMKFIIDVTGFTDWESRIDDYAYKAYLVDKVLAAFQKYNEENPNNPLKEADDKEVSFTN